MRAIGSGSVGAPVATAGRRWAIAIFLLTIVVRGALLSRVPEPEFSWGRQTAGGWVSGDEGINIAVAVAERRQFADPYTRPTGPSAHVPPAFPFATAAIFRVFGFGRAAAVVRNSINIAGYGLLYASFPAAAAALGMGTGAGVLAGLGAAAVPPFRSSEVFRGRDEWAAALLFLWLTVLVRRLSVDPPPSRRDAVALGVGWGVLLHIQPATLTVLPLHALIWLILSRRPAFAASPASTPGPAPYRRSLAVAAQRMALAAAILVLLLVPWTIRNYQALGGWFLVRDNLGIELWISNGEGAQPSMIANQRTNWYERHPMLSVAAQDEIRRDGELAFNRRRLEEAWRWITANRDRFAGLTLSRIAAFWVDLPSSPVTFVQRLAWSVAGWAGVLLLWRLGHRLTVAYLVSILIVYPLVYYVMQYSNRYVVAISFAIFLPAGFAADWAAGQLRRWRSAHSPSIRSTLG
jgi:hypothetical protein